nr:hypothetical protein [Tanacetum cinerariifolium]
MTDNRTIAEMLRAPTEGCVEAIVVPPILAEQFELKHRAARRWLEKEPPRSITTWDDLLDTFYNALNPADQDSLNAAAGGNLLEKSPQDALTIIENKSKVRNSRSKPIDSPVNACDNHSSSEIAKLTQAVNQQTSAVTTTMTAMLKQLQTNPPSAQVKAVEEICVTCRGAHPYYQCLAAGGNTFLEFWDNIQGYVSAVAGNYNQGNPGYRPQGVANQMRPLGFAQPNVQNNQNRFGQPQGFNRGTNFNQEQPYQATAQSNHNFHLNELEKIKRMNDVSLKAMQNQIDMTNEIKNMMASLVQMNTAFTSGSGSLPGNTVTNPKGELKAITTRTTGNFNQGNLGYRPQGVANQMRPPGFAQLNVQNNPNRFGQPQGFNRSLNFNQEPPYQATQSNQNFHLNELKKIKRMNDVSLKAMQNQIDMVKNELRNEMKTSIQTSLSNQTNEIKNMMASLLQMNTASTSGSGTLPDNTIANPKGELKAITTRSGLVTEGPTVPNPHKPVNPEEDECVEETYTDPDHAE